MTSPPPPRPPPSPWQVLLFVPNLIGYARIVLLAAAFAHFDAPAWFLACYGAQALLDGA